MSVSVLFVSCSLPLRFSSVCAVCPLRTPFLGAISIAVSNTGTLTVTSGVNATCAALLSIGTNGILNINTGAGLVAPSATPVTITSASGAATLNFATGALIGVNIAGPWAAVGMFMLTHHHNAMRGVY